MSDLEPVAIALLPDSELMAFVQNRRDLLEKRDAITAGFEMPEDIGTNPVAMMGIVQKLPEMKEAYELTGNAEQLSSRIIQQFCLRMAEGS